MRARPLVWFALVDLAFALGLPILYGIMFAGCGPPNFFCFLRGGCFVMVCGNSWAEFPAVMAFGAIVGLLPGGVAAAATHALPRPSPQRDLAAAAFALPTGVAPLAVLAGPPGLVLGLVAWPIMAAFLVAFSAPLLAARRAYATVS